MKQIGIVALVAILMLSVNPMVSAQDRPVHEVYSMMMYNFTKYVQWPDHQSGGEFVIGVVGNTDVYNTLNGWYGGKPKGSKTYVIKRFNSASEVTDCHVIYIDKSKSGEFEAINNKVKGKERS